MDIGIRYLFREGVLRPRLSSFYDAVLVSNNAAQLAALKLGMKPDASGSRASEQGLAQFSEWIDDMHALALDDGTFEKTILEPFRLASRHACKSGTVPVTGLVFYVSEPYYDHSFNANQRTVALISPELRSAFSVRLKDRCAGGMSSGMYRFNNAKPIPLTNRLHLSKPSIGPVDSPDRFEEWDFLGAAMDDLACFGCSVEAEHYCEVPVFGSDTPRTLGAVLTVAGRVEHAGGSSIQVRSATSDAVEEFFASGGLRPEQIAGLEGKYVKALIVKRYDEAAGRSGPKPMELFLVRKIAKRDAVRHDVAAHVRIRRGVPEEALAERFGSGIDFGRIPGVAVRSGRASPAREVVAPGGLIGSYLRTIGEIEKLRASASPAGGPLHSPEDVLDPERLSLDRLAKDGHAVTALVGLIRAADFEADPGPAAKEVVAQIPRRKKAWLIESGCIAKDAHWAATGRGLDVACAYKKSEMGRLVGNSGTVSVPSLEGAVSPSLLCRYLEKRGYRRARHRGIEYGLIWTRQDPDDPDHAGEIDAMCSPILREMSKRTHPLHRDALRESLADRGSGMSLFSLKKSLNLLEGTGDLARSGDCYSLGLERRVALLLEEAGDGGAPFGDIVSKSKIPRTQEPDRPSGMTRAEAEREIKASLSALAGAGKAAEVVPDHWVWESGRPDLDRTRIKIIGAKAEAAIVRTLKLRPTDEDTLVRNAAYQISGLCRGDGWWYSARDTAADAVRRLLERGVLGRDDWSVFLRSDPAG